MALAERKAAASPMALGATSIQGQSGIRTRGFYQVPANTWALSRNAGEGQYDIQIRKAAAQARRSIIEQQRPIEKDVSSLRRRMESLKTASFIVSAFALGGVVLSLLLIGSSYAAADAGSFPRNIVLLTISALFLLASRRLRSRLSYFMRTSNI